MSAATTACARVVGTTLSTPAGRPTSSNTAARANMLNGVCWAGLTTTVQPAESAGPIFRIPMASGKFHGVTSRHGPTGWRIVCIRVRASGGRCVRPFTRTASSENHRRYSAAYWTSDRDSGSALPISSVMSHAGSSERSPSRRNAA